MHAVQPVVFPFVPQHFPPLHDPLAQDELVVHDAPAVFKAGKQA
jgi:hypothetical protein